jgi:hypothetical protein
MKRLEIGNKPKQQKGTRQNVGDKKQYKDIEKIDLRVTAEKMAAIAQKKIEGKTLVAHPTLKNTWIYE